MTKTNWTYRRRTITVALLYCAIAIGYLLGWGHGESSLHDTVASNVLLLAFTVIGGYVFGRAADTQANGESGTEASSNGKDTNLGTWENRRKIIFLTLLFCGVAVMYLIVRGEDSTLNCTLASGICLLAAGTINSYIFGSAYDDYALRTKLGK